MRLLKILFVLFILLSNQQSFSQVIFLIEEVPKNNSENIFIYISGDFEGWTGGQEKYKLKPINDKHIITIPSQNESINFKFTKGNWEHVETDKKGNNIDNRTYTFKNKNDTVRVKISNWANNTTKKSTASKNVSIISDSFEVPQLKRDRRIWIYLPPNYNSSNKSFPVLYMHDGQNLFDRQTAYSREWEVDESLNQLFKAKKIELIVIGIDNGGSKRIDEYSPWKNEKYGGGEGDLYLEFIVKTLKPFIDKNYRTQSDRQSTGIMGSSMGGLIAHYSALKYPHIFGKIGGLSPSFWFSKSSFTYAIGHSNLKDTKMYLSIGSLEIDPSVSDLNKMSTTMINNGFPTENLKVTIVENGKHNEVLWKKEFVSAINWLYNK